ncbi:hypothetical protein [Capnocytophaga sp. oral taxon 878]|uniref:hypothetical protein n=1 Tax=Capnocytophaga sp. oral taxon 878 TaxID=1316596 RepID=UPI000D035463|nr:hypothetical protein [Capnocytophaga sp. oral taxon 878]AVM50032.1 hypothetical protein C4H12_05890 [Capnocytophaga sp. oral taxon 878]
MEQSLFEEEKEYVAFIEATNCRTYKGFIKALNEAFFIHTNYEENINDTHWYIFSSWLGYRKIKMLFLRSGALKKQPIYNEIINDLQEWKIWWEKQHPKNRLIFEFQ